MKDKKKLYILLAVLAVILVAVIVVAVVMLTKGDTPNKPTAGEGTSQMDNSTTGSSTDGEEENTQGSTPDNLPTNKDDGSNKKPSVGVDVEDDTPDKPADNGENKSEIDFEDLL